MAFSSALISCGARSAQILLASASPKNQPSSSEPGTQLNSTQLTDFFKSPKILRAPPVRDVTRTL